MKVAMLNTESELSPEIIKMKKELSRELEYKFQQMFENRYPPQNERKNFSSHSNRDTTLPHEICTNYHLTKHLLANGSLPLIINGKNMRITYSTFSKAFYITDANGIIMGEPINCTQNDENINDHIRDWKQVNKYLMRHMNLS